MWAVLNRVVLKFNRIMSTKFINLIDLHTYSPAVSFNKQQQHQREPKKTRLYDKMRHIRTYFFINNLAQLQWIECSRYMSK